MSFKMILKDQSKPAPLGGVVAGEAGIGSTAVRPNAALRGAGGAARASAAAPPGAKQTHTACSRTATDSHTEKSGERADARDVERAAREDHMRIRCAADAEGARRAERA
jgi:hypothetical protein